MCVCFFSIEIQTARQKFGTEVVLEGEGSCFLSQYPQPSGYEGKGGSGYFISCEVPPNLVGVGHLSKPQIWITNPDLEVPGPPCASWHMVPHFQGQFIKRKLLCMFQIGTSLGWTPNSFPPNNS